MVKAAMAFSRMNLINVAIILGLSLFSCVTADSIRRGLATSAPTDAPADAAGGASGSAPAGAPAAGGASGSAPAGAPAAGGASGSTPAGAPAAGGANGSAPAGAPAAGGGAGGFDITQYGAKADDPKSDNFDAFVKAFTAACQSGGPAKMVIPKGNFYTGPVTLRGPCKGKIEIENLGTVTGTTDLSAYTEPEWFSFDNIDGLTMTGGTYDGQGAASWKSNDCAGNTKGECHSLPANIHFNKISNAIVEGVTSLNAKQFHWHIFDCSNLQFHNLVITAPGDSPNTDGMHLSSVTGASVKDSVIGTGDDCISIGQGTTNVEINNITCGPGHGISVGSLAKRPEDKPVSGISVTNCKLTKTTNGARIKTYGNAVVGKATNITYDGIEMVDVANPIIIDQNYDKSNSPSHWTISDIHFKNIKGTTPTEAAISFLCSSANPCTGIEVADVELTSSSSKPLTSSCTNTKPTFTGKMSPPAC